MNEWISVKDKLPTDNGKYLIHKVCVYGSFISIAEWTPNYMGFEEHLEGKAIWYKYDSAFGDYEVDGVTHWMPLPEAPGNNTF